MVDVLLDTSLDVIKIVPFLFLTYLFLEWLETQTDKKFENILKKHEKLAVVYGSILGLFPSCGFSSVASSLFATNVISAGVLAAVFLSTSDEMIALMLSSGASPKVYLPILLVKLIVAIPAGLLLHSVMKKKDMNIEEFCEREHDDHSHGILHSAIQHTIQVTIWLFIITLVLNGIVELIGMETIQAVVASNKKLSILLCAFLGMIPNCASSIILSTMYLESIITFPAVCAGLLANAGTGAIVLFRVNPKIKENLTILFYVFTVALISGLLLTLFF